MFLGCGQEFVGVHYFYCRVFVFKRDRLGAVTARERSFLILFGNGAYSLFATARFIAGSQPRSHSRKWSCSCRVQVSRGTGGSVSFHPRAAAVTMMPASGGRRSVRATNSCK